MFPTYSITQMQNFYSSPESFQKRYHQLITHFQKTYSGSKPDFISRAPGRVNIIGEHIDYQGYGVFPAAIEKDCLIAVKRVPTNTVQISHTLSDKYPSFKASNNPKVYEQYPNKYLTYFMAGYRAGLDQFTEYSASSSQQPKQQLNEPTGLQVTITGNIPIGSGVSSSSALVVCSALASYHANVNNFKPLISSSNKNSENMNNQQPQQPQQLNEFIESCIYRQKQSGTAGGGMDQSISVMGKLDTCLYVTFNPIKCEKIEVPSKCRLIVMNSLVESLKSNTAIYRYNKRVCECRLALFLLCKRLGIEYVDSEGKAPKMKILKDLQDFTGLSLGVLSGIVVKQIQRKPYTRKDIEEQFGSEVWSHLSDIQLSSQVIEANTQYNLFQASFHVFTESQRVLNLIEICRSNLPDSAKRQHFGQLMNKSHESCRNIYKCSCPQLDQLTSQALKYGALGSRLTGAGWGGCVVSLVEENKVGEFIEKMTGKEGYYGSEEMREKVEREGGIENVVFESKPGEGACVIGGLE